ncbi:hypothetical protein OKW43_005126 [Paraburkholderia sp. WC7.3g]|uniref:hypothetical protein n=1 Tax=Paraburkholderia sp. WC7.3g TaxID=2991070 RepID=UPI003D242FA8
MNNKMKSWCRALVAALALTAWFCESAYANRSQEIVRKPAGTCRFLESVELELPFNTTELSKEQRQTIKTAFERTKEWPKVEIQAFITAGAYTGERDLETLKEHRGKLVKAYLTGLGIRSKDIYIGTKTMTDFFVVKRPDGELAVQAIYIELTPICGGSCQWMCDAALE